MAQSGDPSGKGLRPRRRGATRAEVPPSSKFDFPVVGIGASAGGLEASRQLLQAIPAETGMAFILVQHLDPTHESVMVDLLASHTAMTIRQVTEGMLLERNHLYIIPPGASLSISRGNLHLAPPSKLRGARLPFDTLLHSLAEECGPRAVCVVLSGTGADGSIGLRTVKAKGGLVVVQEPPQAAYDGMPLSAIETGLVDFVLPVADIPDVIIDFAKKRVAEGAPASQIEAQPDQLLAIIELLRANTAHDFTHYKQGTLRRRIEHRMAVAIGTNSLDRYLAFLRSDASEPGLLAKDLLINVTSFFRDSEVFELLAETIVPDLVRRHTSDRPLRIWIAGCSTGEETYSLAMLFREVIDASDHFIKLQIFASDIDADAVIQAREGLYPNTIESVVSPARLVRYFTKDENGYRVSPDLRGSVVFTVQDVLVDPPFSQLDFVSCRNLLIYLQPEAQAKVISLFHFSLLEGGLLLLGGAETVVKVEGRFELVSKSAQLYRHIVRYRPGDGGLSFSAADAVRPLSRQGAAEASSPPDAYAELCRTVVLDRYAPAAILIDSNRECLFSLGPTDRYLRMAPGRATLDLLAMVPQDLQGRLRVAIHQAQHEGVRSRVAGTRIKEDGVASSFGIEILPVRGDTPELLLVCFVEDRKLAPDAQGSTDLADPSRVAELEREIELTRAELRNAARSLEVAAEEQKSKNDDALSVNEEYQAANEELMASKEELQSLNEELTALNGQLQETLDRQRTTSDDLQNILYSSDIATLFLDSDLRIRFFTPNIKSLFSIIPSDVDRPLADLHSLADRSLQDEAQSVLQGHAGIEREIAVHDRVWCRHVLPYLTRSGGVAGVVITFTDITHRKQAAKDLEEAKRKAELANTAKSRFLAAASHDLRQPLQALHLLQGLLGKAAESEKAKRLVTRQEAILLSMTGMLDTLLDINQIDSGSVSINWTRGDLNAIFDRLRDEFLGPAQAQGLELRVIPCSVAVRSDQRLLEQMIRNLLANALKYTQRGRILLGCRRRGGTVSIEVWDTGIGISKENLQTIFEEFHQLDNPARERSRGLGLGLSIVERLGALLGHPVRVSSQPGKGSVFSIAVKAASGGSAPPQAPDQQGPAEIAVEPNPPTAAILIIEDDPAIRDLVEILLVDAGHLVATASDGPAALGVVARGFRPDLLLADYSLPNGLSGLELASSVRDKLHRQIPAVILTGDISTNALRLIANAHCVHMNKPVPSAKLVAAIAKLLMSVPAVPNAPRIHAILDGRAAGATIFVIDDNPDIRETFREVLTLEKLAVETFSTCEEFTQSYQSGREGCLVIDAYLPGMNGLELLRWLRNSGDRLPAIMVTGNSDVSLALAAMKVGASDFLEKPIGGDELVASVKRALANSRESVNASALRDGAARRLAGLTRRQREIMVLVLEGHPSKNIAADLGISQRTVENHRAAIMHKTGTKSLPALARLALAAAPPRLEKPAA